MLAAHRLKSGWYGLPLQKDKIVLMGLPEQPRQRKVFSTFPRKFRPLVPSFRPPPHQIIHPLCCIRVITAVN